MDLIWIETCDVTTHKNCDLMWLELSEKESPVGDPSKRIARHRLAEFGKWTNSHKFSIISTKPNLRKREPKVGLTNSSQGFSKAPRKAGLSTISTQPTSCKVEVTQVSPKGKKQKAFWTCPISKFTS